MSNDEKVMKVVDALNGITFQDWIKIKQSVDAAFSSKTARLQNSISISPEEVMTSYLRLF